MPPAEQLQHTMTTLAQKGINSVLCLLEEEESITLGLANEQTACEAANMHYRQFAIPDFGVPEPDELYSLVAQLTDELKSGKHIVVHCRGGIGRTGLICCCILVATGLNAQSAMELVSQQRGCKVPETAAQTGMIEQFALVQQSTR